MKKMMIYAGILLLGVACQTPPPPVENKAPEKVAINPADFPFTLKEAYKDWQIGDQKNAIAVMRMLKAWENKNVEECISYFGDTVEMAFDHYRAILPHDSLTSFVQYSLSDVASVNIEMGDWESVVSADGKEEWVTLWYKQRWVDTKGVADSMNAINDARFENGKIVAFHEYVQHYPAKK